MAALSLGRVECAEAIALFYVNQPFFEMMCSVETVFDQLMNEENVYIFGVFIVNDVAHYSSKVDLGLGQFIPGHSEEESEAVHRAIVSCYGNIRGKDFARK